MNSLVGYKQWQQLFDEDVSKIWEEESLPILKTVSMMLFSIDREIKKIQDALNTDILFIRNHIEAKSDFKNDQDQMHTIKSYISRMPRGDGGNPDKLHIQKTSDFVTKELSQNESGSIILSDDNVKKKNHNSPEIKKKYKHKDYKWKLRRKRKLNDSMTSTESLLRDIKNVTQFDNSSFKANDEQNNSSIDFLQDLPPHKDIEKDRSNIGLQINDSTQIGDTPQKPDSDLDFSIIQCTPKIVESERKNQPSTYLLNRRIRNANKVTLSEIFFNKAKIETQGKYTRSQSKNYDSDETHVTSNVTNKITENESTLGVTNMVSYINKEPSIKHAEKSEMNSSLNPDEIGELIASVRYEDFEENTSLNCGILEENYDFQKPDPSTELNEFLGKAQNVPNQLKAESIVRGNARKKLPSWSCKDCERFYLKQGLNPDEVLALNKKCSKHRGYYRPREDTLPGFWDMDLATQETDNTT